MGDGAKKAHVKKKWKCIKKEEEAFISIKICLKVQ